MMLRATDSPYRRARVMVFGASGFIGRWVAQALSAHGAWLYLPVRDPLAARELFHRHGIEAEPMEFDIEHGGSLLELLREVRPSIVFHLAGYGVDHSETGEQPAWRINAAFTGELARAVAGARDLYWPAQVLVHAGSALEYGAIDGDLAEDSEPNPTTTYGRSKLEGTRQIEQYCKETGIAAVTARLFTVYGAGEHAGRLLPSLIEASHTDGVVPLTSGVQQRDFTYVKDVAEGLLRLGLIPAESGSHTVVNLATGRLTPVRQFVETAAGLLGIPSIRLGFGLVPTRFTEMKHNAVNLHRLERLLAWRPETSIEEGIRQTLLYSKHPQMERVQ
ncbi:MAG: NAD(P)-dependent oxidoreductase [Bryobacterales bacterium]|nr:NAD(P)-dependent oxidoreductase [Bryobacterales bacterium]